VGSRSGGVLSASALVALGTSVLLVALIGLGLSELASPPGGAATRVTHAEAAAVVVPAITTQRHAAAGKVRHRSTSTRSSIPVATPAVTPTYAKASAVPATSPTRTTSHAGSTSTRKSSSATASPSPTHGNGKGKAKGSGNGHKKP